MNCGKYGIFTAGVCFMVGAYAWVCFYAVDHR
jgi:hypothetical protein